jgi:hypothetical protein
MRINNSSTTPFFHRQMLRQRSVIKPFYLFEKLVLSSTLDWDQYIACMIFAYDTNYHRTIPFEIMFELEQRTDQNLILDLRRQYGEDMGTEMFKRLQVCQNLAKKSK